MQTTDARWNASPSGDGKDSADPDDNGLSTFLRVRPRLFRVTYRMLRNAAEAEDVVQDVWIRWQRMDRSRVRDATAFLVTTATRLAINLIQSARSRHETCARPSSSDPVDRNPDPGLAAERGEGLKAGLLLLIKRLSLRERAAYILREAFDYSYRDIASVLGIEEANARQVVTRAKQHVADGRRVHANSIDDRTLLEAFTHGINASDASAIEELVVVQRAFALSQRVPSSDRGMSASIWL